MNYRRILTYLKKHWQRVALITGALLVCFSALSVVVLTVSHRRAIEGERPGHTGEAERASPVARTYTDLYAVLIDNHADSRPPSGLEAAEIVYEAPVEGGITRFLAVYERGNEVAEIGPVRSARAYYLDWIAELGPSLFLHVGGSPESLARIRNDATLRESDADGIGWAGVAYWRDKKRFMPHNAYTSSALVEDLFGERGGDERRMDAWLMAAAPSESELGAGRGAAIPFHGTAYRPEWRYERAENAYVRHHRGTPELTRDGKRLLAQNVAVMFTDVSTIDAVGRKRIRTTGEGEGIVFRNGEMLLATWRNEAYGAPVLFFDEAGNEIAFTQGNVWIEVVPKELTVETVLPTTPGQ